MRAPHKLFLWVAVVGFVFLAMSGSEAEACSVCYGDPGSPMVTGARNGVLFLAATVYALLMLVIAVVVSWAIRAKKLDAATALALEAARDETDSIPPGDGSAHLPA